MASSAYLTGENAAVADLCRACEAHLAAKHGVSANAGSVADDDEVVELGTASDARFSDSGTVNAGICLDFDIVLENGRAGLLHLVPSSVFLLGKTKAVSADDGTVLQNDTISDTAKFANHSMRVREEIIADLNALIDVDETVQNGVLTDLDIFADNAIRSDMGPCADFCRFGNEGRRVESLLVTRRLIEKLDGVGEREVRICSAQCRERGHGGVSFDVDAFLNQDGRGASRFEKREVAPVGDKSDLAGFGVFNPGDSVDGSFAGALETAT